MSSNQPTESAPEQQNRPFDVEKVLIYWQSTLFTQENPTIDLKYTLTAYDLHSISNGDMGG